MEQRCLALSKRDNSLFALAYAAIRTTREGEDSFAGGLHLRVIRGTAPMRLLLHLE